MTPCLSDIQGVEELGGDTKAILDNRMEIILTGFSWESYSHDGPNGQCYGIDGECFGVMVFQLNNAGNSLVRLDSETKWEEQFHGNFNSYSIAAVGDMNNDGNKNVAICNRSFAANWEYIAGNGIGSKLSARASMNVQVNDDAGFYTPGPVLADIDNEGSLRMVVPQFTGTEDWRTRIYVLDRSCNNHQDWQNRIFNGYFAEMGEFPAIGDMEKDGTPDIVMHLLDDGQDHEHWIYCFEHSGINIQGPNIANWPATNEGLGAGSIPIIADIYQQDDYMDIVISNKIDGGDNDINIYSLTSLDPVLGSEASVTPAFSTPALSNLSGDENLSIVSRSIGINGNNMQIEILDAVDIAEGRNWQMYSEWCQLMNGPRHDGLYAQCYEFAMPLGHNWWRDRVIITDDIIAASDDVVIWPDPPPPLGERKLTIEDNAVVEVNDGVEISFLGDMYGEDGCLFIGDNVVFKPNSENDEFTIYTFPFEMQDGVIDNGEVVLDPGADGVCTFENVVFDGNLSGQAVTAEDIEISFINCTFRNYETAMVLDACTGAITNCTFENCAYEAVQLWDCAGGLTIDSCDFHDNGMAIYMYESHPVITANEIYDNECAVYGAAVYAYNSSPHLRDNDF